MKRRRRLFSMLGSCLLASVVTAASVTISGNDVVLKFNPAQSVEKTLVLPDGKTVKYEAYEKIYYVANVEDSTYQYLNFYVPEGVKEAPIFLRTYVGGYMAARAMEPSATDATGRALGEGYVVCIPGSRGSNSVVTQGDGGKTYTGRIPAGLLDLKAAVRYLRYNDRLMPGNAEKIITDGTSAGGAMSSLLGATGNHPVYEPYLKAMGAAEARDDVFASVCYCPITDLEHADMGYEWLYGCTNQGIRNLDEEQQGISDELAAAYPAYLNSLGLKKPDGTLLTDQNYPDYLKSFLIRSAQRAKDEGCDLPDSIGIRMNVPQGSGVQERTAPSFGPQGRNIRHRQGEFVTDIEMDKYLTYVASTQPLKTPPAFDSQGVISGKSSPENQAFGDSDGRSANFTAYSLRKATVNPNATLPDALAKKVWMMNPMNFIGDASATTTKHWYIRHGARDRDTGFQVSVNLATKLMNNGYDVNFALPWNRPHSGDYNLNDLFAWIATIVVSDNK